MKRLMLSVLCTAATVGAQSPQAPTFRAIVDSVVVDVAVRQHDLPVNGLTVADFDVLDNGVKQTVVDVSQETWPIDIRLLLDTSGSVGGTLTDTIRRAADTVRRRLRPSDRMAVTLFNQRAIDALPLQPIESLRTIPLAGGAPWGGTAIVDAIAMASLVAPERERRQMTVVVTDGRDTFSVLDEAATMDVVRASESTLFFIGLTRQPTSVQFAGPFPHRQFFESLTAVSGGRFELLRSNQTIDAAFESAIDDFRSSYVLRYVAQGVDRAGWHDLSVRVARPGAYDVRARRGYLGDSAK